MPALNVAASPVVIAPKGPVTGPAGAATNAADAESAENPFASVLNEQMNGAATAKPDANTKSDAAEQGSLAEPAADSLAALIPVLLGTAANPAGPQVLGDKDTEGSIVAQAELAMAMLAPPVAATGDGAAVSLRGRGTTIGPIAGRTDERAAVAPGTADVPAIVAAADEGIHDMADVPGPSAKADATALAVTAALEKAQRDSGRSDATPDVAGIGADRTLPEQAMVPMHANAALRHAGAEDTTYRVTPSLGSRQWESAVGNSLVIMAGQQQSSAEIVLTPPQLGRIEISLTVNANNEATATFVSASPAVQEALTNAVPRLKEILADAGITLSQADVNAGSPEQSPGGNGESQRRPATADFGGEPGARAVAVGNWSGAGRGLVDVFA